jgi:hypothetical protein
MRDLPVIQAMQIVTKLHLISTDVVNLVLSIQCTASGAVYNEKEGKRPDGACKCTNTNEEICSNKWVNNR